MTDDISFTTIDGLRIRYSVRGSGRPLLLLNGIGASLELMDPFRKRLSDTLSVTFDVPGVGESETPARPQRLAQYANQARQLMDELGFDSFDVLGISWGGMLAQQLALDHPHRVKRLVLVATGTGWTSRPSDPRAMAIMATPFRYSSKRFFETVAPTIYGGDMRSDVAMASRAHGRWVDHPPSQRGYLFQMMAVSGWSSLRRLKSLPHETLVLSGDDDPIVRESNAHAMGERIPKSHVRIVQGGGHLFLLSRAEVMGPLVEQFCARGLAAIADQPA